MKDCNPQNPTRIDRLDAAGVLDAADALGALLVDCVEGGASVSFMAGLTQARAAQYWRSVAASMDDGRAVIIARRTLDRVVIGTVQMIPVCIENQPHRAEIAKMLVRRDQRNRGVGADLMRAAEEAASEAGRTVLTLDTASDVAARLYERLGWTCSGVIPNYALSPDGRPCATRLYYKEISRSG